MIRPISAFILSWASALLVLVSSCHAEESELPEATNDQPDIVTVLEMDRIPAISEPLFVRAQEAEIGDDAPVIGVALGDEAHCYSLWLLNGHEIVNDEVGGTPIAVTW